MNKIEDILNEFGKKILSAGSIDIDCIDPHYYQKGIEQILKKQVTFIPCMDGEYVIENRYRFSCFPENIAANILNSENLTLGYCLDVRAEVEPQDLYVTTGYISFDNIPYDDFVNSINPKGFHFALYNDKLEFIKDTNTIDKFPEKHKLAKYIRAAKLHNNGLNLNWTS